MSTILRLAELAESVPGGVRLGIGGVHLSRLPIALIRRILAGEKKNFVFISWGGGLPLELFLEANAVRKLIFCFSSLDIFGLAPKFREALEQNNIEIEEWSALAMAQGLHAAHFNLPEMPFQVPVGSDLMRTGTFWKETVSAFTGEPVAQARRLDVDALLLHAQAAQLSGDRAGAQTAFLAMTERADTRLLGLRGLFIEAQRNDDPVAAVAIAEEALKLTNGKGVDLILDAVGKPTLEKGLRCLAPFGHLALYGRSGGATDPLNVATLSPKSVKVSGFSLPTITRNFPDKTRESAERCFALLREGKLKLHIGKIFPLAEAAEAHRYLESRQSTGKLLLIP